LWQPGLFAVAESIPSVTSESVPEDAAKVTTACGTVPLGRKEVVVTAMQ